MVHEVNPFGDPSLAGEPRDGTPRRSPRSIVADAIRHTAARAVPRQARSDDGGGFGMEAEPLRRPGLDAVDPALPDLASLLGGAGGLGGLAPIQSLTGRTSLITAPLEAAGADLDELRAGRATVLAQELRATLALISGYSQSLARLPLDDESRRRYLEELPVAAAHLAGVTNEILEMCLPAQEPSPPHRIPLRRVSP